MKVTVLEVINTVTDWMLQALYNYLGMYGSRSDERDFVDSGIPNKDALYIHILLDYVYGYGDINEMDLHQVTKHMRNREDVFMKMDLIETKQIATIRFFEDVVNEAEAYFEQWDPDEIDEDKYTLAEGVISSSINKMLDRMYAYVEEKNGVSNGILEVSDAPKIRIIMGSVLSNIKYGKSEGLIPLSVMEIMYDCFINYMVEDTFNNDYLEYFKALFEQALLTISDYVRCIAAKEAKANTRCTTVYTTSPNLPYQNQQGAIYFRGER